MRLSIRLGLALLLVHVLTAQTRAGDYIVYVGSYTNTTAKGIYASRFESKTGALSPLELVAEDVYPAQLWATPNGRFLYAANWQGTDAAPGDTIAICDRPAYCRPHLPEQSEVWR